MKNKYSIFSLARNAVTYHENWREAWRSPDPKKKYDVIVIGGGGHGLATAYYLASQHGIRNVAVLEKNWIGGGNTGRNTTIVRSNYLWDESSHLYEKSLQLWEGLSQELNYNVMFSQRGVMNLGHTLQDMRDIGRRSNANYLNGIDSEVLSPKQIRQIVPIMNTSPNARYPYWEHLFNGAGELPVMMRSHGDLRGPQIGKALISFRTVKSLEFSESVVLCQGWKQAAAE